ncbi:DUF5069 domain-containing protein [Nitrospira defluvii]|nr:DUF5069 domain-containing protein [Nitrospira defluvii]
MNFPFKINHKKLKPIVKDLSKEYPRSPREKIAGYVIAARCLDKCRAYLVGTLHDYEFNCKLDRMFFDLTAINVIAFMEFVATGADDDEVAGWITDNALQRNPFEIVKWNNRMRERLISELPDESQLFLEEYIPKYIPANKSVVTLFDVFDAEERRI